MRRYKTYIFDLDGTLLDTLTDLAASVNHALRQGGMPERSLGEVRMFLGNGIRRLMEQAVPEGCPGARFEEVFEAFRTYYTEHSMDTTKPYPGIVDTLRQLKARRCRIAIVSNKFHTATKELAARFFSGLVDVAIGENEAAGIRRKPAPDTVAEALKRLGTDLNDAVYVGDSEVDIETAANSSLPVISVLWGFRERDFLLRHGAVTLISEPHELLAATE